MYEFLLHAPVSANRHTIVLSALTGFTALQPQAFAERHLLFRPSREPGSAPEPVLARKAKALRLPAAFINDTFYVQAVGSLVAPLETETEADGSAALKEASVTNDATAADNNQPDAAPKASTTAEASPKDVPADDNVMVIDDEKDSSKSSKNQTQPSISSQKYLERLPWTVEFRDVPAVPVKTDPATKRAMLDVELPLRTNPVTYLANLDYRFTGEHVLVGYRFSHGNIDLRLFRGYRLESISDGQIKPTALALPVSQIDLEVSNLVDGQQPPLTIPVSPEPESSSDDNGRPEAKSLQFATLDAAGTYMLQARLYVGDDGNPEVMSAGLAEMGALRETLRGFIDLELGDRFAMNTRIR